MKTQNGTKKQYSAPKLTGYGNVARLTHKSGARTDSNMKMA